MKAPEIKQQISEVEKKLQRMKEDINRNQEVNLTPIQLDIEQITEAITQLPEDQRSDLKKPMVHLMSVVDEVHNSLKDKHKELTAQLKGLNTAEQATKAYKTPDDK